MPASHLLAAASSGSLVGLVIAAGVGVLMYREARSTQQRYGTTPFGRSPAFWAILSFLVLIIAVPAYFLGKWNLTRRRGTGTGYGGPAGGYGGPAGGYGPAAPGGEHPGSPGAAGYPGQVPSPPPPAGPPAGWFADPSGRHQQRYWDGTRWTEHVADGGATSVDPPV